MHACPTGHELMHRLCCQTRRPPSRQHGGGRDVWEMRRQQLASRWTAATKARRLQACDHPSLSVIQLRRWLYGGPAMTAMARTAAAAGRSSRGSLPRFWHSSRWRRAASSFAATARPTGAGSCLSSSSFSPFSLLPSASPFFLSFTFSEVFTEGKKG